MMSDKGIIHSEVLEMYLTAFILLVPDFERIKIFKVMWYHGISYKAEGNISRNKTFQKDIFCLFLMEILYLSCYY